MGKKKTHKPGFFKAPGTGGDLPYCPQVVPWQEKRNKTVALSKREGQENQHGAGPQQKKVTSKYIKKEPERRIPQRRSKESPGSQGANRKRWRDKKSSLTRAGKGRGLA